MLAVRLPSIQGSRVLGPSENVLSQSDRLKMLRIDTRSLPAEMVKSHS